MTPPVSAATLCCGKFVYMCNAKMYSLLGLGFSAFRVSTGYMGIVHLIFSLVS